MGRADVDGPPRPRRGRSHKQSRGRTPRTGLCRREGAHMLRSWSSTAALASRSIGLPRDADAETVVDQEEPAGGVEEDEAVLRPA